MVHRAKDTGEVPSEPYPKIIQLAGLNVFPTTNQLIVSAAIFGASTEDENAGDVELLRTVKQV